MEFHTLAPDGPVLMVPTLHGDARGFLMEPSSPAFGRSYAVVLDAEAHHIFWVPPGFAHGFLVLGDGAEFVYKCTTYYAPDDECCLKWDDPSLGIDWPVPEAVPTLSEKDTRGLPLAQCPTFA